MSPEPEFDEDDWSVVHNHEVRQAWIFSREGRYLAVGLQTGETYIYDIRTFSYRVLVEHIAREKPSIWTAQFSPDDKYVAVGGSDARIKIWNIAERRALAVFKGHANSVVSVTFSPDGQFLVSGSLDGSVRIWCMRDGSSKKLFDDNMSDINSITLSPDGRYVAAASYDDILRIWDFRSGQLLERYRPKGLAPPLWSVAFTSDGRGLLSGGDDAAVKFWDVSSLTAHQPTSRRGAVDSGNIDVEKAILTLRRHTQTVYSVSTFPDTRWLLSCSRDCSVCIWDAQTYTWQWTLNGHQKPATASDASPDGHHLASGSEDCLVRIWSYEQAG